MLPEVFSFLFVLFFGILAVVFSAREEKVRKLLKDREEAQKQRLYQISILREIQDRIGYSLDIEEIIDVITGSLRNLFPYSSTSSLVLKNDKVILKVHIEESVSSKFVSQVRQSMLASLTTLIGNLPATLDERVSGVPLDETNALLPASFFHIPLVINNKVEGLISVSSTRSNLYKESEMTILYQITSQASNALTRLKQVLETEKGKLTSMIASFSDGVFMLDTQKQLLIINNAAKKFLKLEKPSPSFFDVLNAFPPEYNLIEKIERATLSKQLLEEKEVAIGENIFQTFITPVIDPTGKVLGTSILLHDITLEKNLVKVKEEFTHIMVHELRAPLTAVKDSSDLILESDLSKDDQKQLIKIINNQTIILLDQISQILDAAKIEAGRFSVAKELADLGNCIRDSVKTFQVQAGKKQIQLLLSIPELPKAYFDKPQITRVLNNLISNSLKFTPPGGKIEVRASSKPDSIEISVSDTGIGIPKDKQKDIFTKFYQLTAGEEHKGTGLGLFIVKGIVEAHNGRVSLESQENKGTTITFTLPFSPSSESQYPLHLN